MKRFSFLLFAILLVTASAALAHGNKKHVLGTVEKINADSIVVKTSDGKSVDVKLVPATVFLKNSQPSKLQDLAVGDRVVIHATPKGDTLEADEVKFGSPGPSAKKSPQR